MSERRYDRRNQGDAAQAAPAAARAKHAEQDDRLLAKLAQLARFGLAAEASPILVSSDTQES